MKSHRFSLVLHPNPVLRVICPPVEVFDSALRDLVQEMFRLMRTHRGIGLAGPQVALEQCVLISDHGPSLPEEGPPGPLGRPAALVEERKPKGASRLGVPLNPSSPGVVP